MIFYYNNTVTSSEPLNDMILFQYNLRMNKPKSWSVSCDDKVVIYLTQTKIDCKSIQIGLRLLGNQILRRS